MTLKMLKTEAPLTEAPLNFVEIKNPIVLDPKVGSAFYLFEEKNSYFSSETS